MSLIQIFVSILLYFVMFFGIAFILNMLLRRTWLMAILYPFIISIVVADSTLGEYFTQPKIAVSDTFQTMTSLPVMDLLILTSGLLGAIVSGLIIKLLRKNGYQMF